MTEKIVNPADVFPEIYQEILDRYGRPKELSITSLPSIDNKIWGLHKKKLVVVAGRPSQGKSSILLQWAYDFALQGKTVVFFSLEMIISECIERMLINQCLIDNYTILTGSYARDAEEYKEAVSAFDKKLGELKFVLVESIGRTFDEIFQTIESFKTPVDVVIIDYIQQIMAGKRQSKKEAIDEYIKRLRNYAIEKDFCAIIGSQINRGTHDGGKIRTPEMWELKGSGDIEEHSDMIFLLHWQYYYTREEDEKDNYWIRLAKNRNGRTGVFDCAFEPQHYKIKEATHEVETESPFRRDIDS